MIFRRSISGVPTYTAYLGEFSVGTEGNHCSGYRAQLPRVGPCCFVSQERQFYRQARSALELRSAQSRVHHYDSVCAEVRNRNLATIVAEVRFPAGEALERSRFLALKAET